MDIGWENIMLAPDETHHLFNGNPLYKEKYKKVLKFHDPGLAAVLDDTGAYNIDSHGTPIYQPRFLQAFGYYQGLAAVESAIGWFHIDMKGRPIYKELYAWCGNFQEGFCTVQDKNTGFYYHINRQGHRPYKENY